MTRFLVTSIVLTVVLNLGIRMIPGVQQWIAERMGSMAERSDPRPEAQRQQPRVRVFFPWKAMLIGSIVLTVLVNVFAAFR